MAKKNILILMFILLAVIFIFGLVAGYKWAIYIGSFGAFVSGAIAARPRDSGTDELDDTHRQVSKAAGSMDKLAQEGNDLVRGGQDLVESTQALIDEAKRANSKASTGE